MGGSQSTPTRKISIPNEESHFIRVSENVVERLKKCTEGNPEKVVKKPAEECPPSDFQKDVSNLENIPVNNQSDEIIKYYYAPSLSSLRILQEKEKELKESEDYWTRRIKNMEDHHSRLSQVMEAEYKKAVEEISCQTPRPPPNTPFPCYDEKEKLLLCLKKNPNETLLCAGEVIQFSDCVHSKRINVENPEGCAR